MQKKIGLIGFPLTHSFSKSFFEEKIKKEAINNLIFENFEIEQLHQFPTLLASNPSLIGLAVTIPHKVSIQSYLDQIDTLAVQIGSVNCIRISNGNTIGFNTDAVGFKKSIQQCITTKPKRALILGTGGSSKTVQYVLHQMGISTTLVSRKSDPANQILGYNDLQSDLIKEHRLIVNTTPLGMYPETDAAPDILYHELTAEHFLFDLIYNPQETSFLEKGKLMGAKICNGLDMLYFQAEENWRIWNQ
jgi:shikimate dehydrogenase